MTLGHQDPDTHRWEDDGGKAPDPLADEAACQVVANGVGRIPPEPLIRSSPAGPAELPAEGGEYRRMIGGG
jgi:hypothetical protein